MKKFFFYSSALLFLLHFLLLGLNKLYPNRFSSAYVYPFFQQNWDLFAPPPDSNYQLYVVLEDGKVRDVLGQIKSQHRANLLAGNEALLVAITNSIHFFEKEASKNTGALVNADTQVNFKIIYKIVQAYFKNSSDSQVNRIILMVIPLNSNEKPRVYSA